MGSKKTDVLIIGAGLAGLSLAYHLKRDYLVIEKEDRAGGLARTERVGDFLFDYTGHLLHLKDRYAKKLITDLLKNNLNEKERNSWIYSNGVFTRYPFQKNTYGLPPQVIKDVILGFLRRKTGTAGNFEDWVNVNFGEGIAKYFMVPYNTKLWMVPLSELATDWLGDYVPKVTIEEIIDGALFDNTERVGYNALFYYPLEGGIESLARSFYKNLDREKFIFGCEAAQINPDEKCVTASNGLKIYYKNLVSTMPLKFLIKRMAPIPSQLIKQGDKLKYISVYNLNLAVKGEHNQDKDWFYLPEPEYICYRIGFPTNFSSYVAPKGYTTLYTEISYSDNRPLNKNTARQRIINDLMKTGIIKNEKEIAAEKTLDIEIGYVLYDHQRKETVESAMIYLKSKGIYTIGRFGLWEYSAMEEAILQGKDTAEMLNETGR